MTAQGYKYLSPPSAQTVGILLFTRRISTSLSRIAIHKGLSMRCDSTRASRTYTVIFVSWALCGLVVEFIVFHYMIFALGINTISFKLDFCLSSTSRQATVFDFSAGPSARGRQLYCRACNFKNVSALLAGNFYTCCTESCGPLMYTGPTRFYSNDIHLVIIQSNIRLRCVPWYLVMAKLY